MTESPSNDSVAAVLALVGQQGGKPATPELPPAPNGSSPGAQTLWFALLTEYEFSIGEMLILEALVAARTHLDEIEIDWRQDGSPTTASGSMGQPVTDPRVQEMRQLRAQIAALVKGLNLPTDADQAAKRPGRPTRSSGHGGSWGTR